MNEQEKRELIRYIFEFAKTYNQYYPVSNDADELLDLIEQRMDLPEDYVTKLLETGKVF